MPIKTKTHQGEQQGKQTARETGREHDGEQWRWQRQGKQQQSSNEQTNLSPSGYPAIHPVAALFSCTACINRSISSILLMHWRSHRGVPIQLMTFFAQATTTERS
mmetsp:Transcript_5183/g.8611  ORF Transcript_5183/g.8611 Transcript_5183/m.8611 type:complete len:105 (+) Transcript_5183:50-364(+)